MVGNLLVLDSRYNFGYIYTDTAIPSDTVVRTVTVDKLVPSRRIYSAGDGWSPAVGAPNQGLLGFSFSANTFVYGDTLKLVNSTETVTVSAYSSWNTSLARYLDFSLQSSYPGSGTSCSDLSLYGPNTTTLTNGPTYNSSLGGYMVFDGVDDYADVNIAGGTSPSVVTIEMWANVSSFNGGMMFGFLYYDIWTTNGSLGFNTANGDVYGLTPTQVTNLGLANNWYHYVFVMYMSPTSYTSNKIYINGVSQSLSQVYSSYVSNNGFNSGNCRISGWLADNGYRLPMSVGLFKAYNNVAFSGGMAFDNFVATRSRFGYEGPIVTRGLGILYDAGNIFSYPGTGTTWKDLQGSRDATLVNGPAYSTNASGNIVFDGVNDYASVSTFTLGNGNLPWTCSAWIRTTTTVNSLGAGSVLSNSSGGPVYSMMGVNNGKIVYWTYQNSAWAQKLGVGTTVNDNKWHLLTWVNYSNSTMDMYVDGALDSNVANSTSGNNNPIDMIGASWAAYAAISIAQVSVYDEALTRAEVIQNFNATRRRYGV